MKKTFLARRNALLSSARVSWGTAAVLFAVVVLVMRLSAPTMFWYVFAPFFRASDSAAVGMHYFLSSFNDAATLTLENEQLIRQNQVLTNDNLALSELAHAVSPIGKTTSRVQGVVAGVVARPPQSPYDTLVIAAGLGEGVTIGMEAFGLATSDGGVGGIPLGLVTSVAQSFSRVTLFSAPHVATAGWVGSSHLPVSVVGGGGGAMSMLFARSAHITEGDVVYVPGPGMVPIGRVSRVEGDPASPSMRAHIMPALNMFSIAWVELRDTGNLVQETFQIASTTP